MSHDECSKFVASVMYCIDAMEKVEPDDALSVNNLTVEDLLDRGRAGDLLEYPNHNPFFHIARTITV